MSLLNTLSSLYPTLSYISELHKFVENTLVKILGMSKGGVQSSKLLGNSHWLLDFPSSGFSMASSCSELMNCTFTFMSAFDPNLRHFHSNLDAAS